MSQEQPFIWSRKLDGPINWVGRVSGDLQGWSNSASPVDRGGTCQFCGSVVGMAQKRDNRSCSPWCQDHGFSQYATGAFPVAILVLELRGTSLSRWVCLVSLRKTAWGSRSFYHQLSPHWFLQPEVVRTYLLGTRTLGWMACGGIGTPCSWDIPQEFLSTTTTRRYRTSPFHVCAPSTSLDGCGFFYSVVVRLPFNSISDGSE